MTSWLRHTLRSLLPVSLLATVGASAQQVVRIDDVADARRALAEARAQGLAARRRAETLEADMPILVERYGLRPDSGGPGRFRGGCGVELTVRVFSPDTVLTARGMERLQFRPWGRAGGMAGAGGAGTARMVPIATTAATRVWGVSARRQRSATIRSRAPSKQTHPPFRMNATPAVDRPRRIAAQLVVGIALCGGAAAQSIPGYPGSIFAFDPREVALLPRFCTYTQHFREQVPGGNNMTLVRSWEAQLGPTFQHLHHYCRREQNRRW